MQLRAILASRSIEEILGDGLHEFIDFLQRYLIAITSRLSAAFFGHAAEASRARRRSGDWPPLAQAAEISS